jgi:flagellar motility protein MotE (MotC chaperone)
MNHSKNKFRCFHISILAGLLLCNVSPLWAVDKPVAVSRDNMELAASLQEREKVITARENELVSREQRNKDLQQEIDVKLARLSTLQKEISEKLAEIKKVQDADFKNLIKVYTTMSSTKLSPLLNQMTDQNVAQILRAMKADQVAKIVPKLDSEKAVRVSRLLGRFE